ncbi:tRNA 2'-phosphotransferase 1 [Culicoides brevitarsis]|uniref:tRNA 2'-phosphotransferase 1 n=1 Tax=Culicoides brevitarsis TaxID=469753 RepID=UPI00307BADF4
MRKIESRDTSISKALSFLLRHGALKAGLPMQSDGFVDVNSILGHPEMQRRGVQLVDLQRIVKNDQKKRFTMEGNRIRANQGHSMKEVSDLELTKLDKIDFDVVHGTYFRYWEAIRSEGLKKMQRNFIHFASTAVFKDAVSGFRSDSEILIFVDTTKAMQDGIEFYRSANGVVLTEGKNGILEPKYFLKVVDRKRGNTLNVL